MKKIISILLVIILLVMSVFGITLSVNSSKHKHETASKTIKVENNNKIRRNRFESNKTHDEEQDIKNDIGNDVEEEQERDSDVSTAVAQARVLEDDNSNIWWLACTIYHEGRGMSDEAQIAIASVVMNRVNNTEFPNTIFEVLVQPKQYSFVRGEIIDGNPDDRALANAVYVYQNGSQIPNNVVYQAMFEQGSGIWKVIDGEYFCYG